MSNRRLLIYVVWSALTLICMLTAQVAADDSAAVKPSTVSLELKGATVADAVKALFAGSDLKYFLRTDTNDKKLDLKLDKVPFETALKTITQQAGLTFAMDEGIYVIAPPEPVDVAEPPVPKPTIIEEPAVEEVRPETAPVSVDVVEPAPSLFEQGAMMVSEDPWSVPPDYYLPEFPVYPDFVRIGNLTLTGGRSPLVFGRAGVFGSYSRPPMDVPPWEYSPINAYMLGRY